MKIKSKGIFSGVLFFLILNLFSLINQWSSVRLENLGLMGVLLTLILLLSGFIAGFIVRNNGFKVGFLTGIFDYLSACFFILVYLYITTYRLAPFSELVLALGKFSIYMFFAVLPIALISSFITGVGGFLGTMFSNWFRQK